jgi:hypothetical protein
MQNRFTAFSQRDPRWSGDPLGTCGYTLGRAGCLVTAAASVLADFGVSTDPKRLNAWLRDHDGYADGCLFRFAAIAGVGAELVELIRRPASPATGDILDALDAGRAVIAELARDGITTHWVRIYAGVLDPGFTWYIMDPWQLPGAELTTIRRAYPGAELRSVAVYAPAGSQGGAVRRSAGPTQEPQRLPARPVQPAVRTLPVSSGPKTNRRAIAASRRALQG